MKKIMTVSRIRTHSNIRTRHSHPISTASGRNLWPRLKETEQLQANENRLPSRVRKDLEVSDD